MHSKFARRLAQIIKAKKKAAGPRGLAAWWDSRFGHLTPEEVRQVKAELSKL